LRSRRAQRAWSPSVNRRFSAIRADSFASHSWSRASNRSGSRLPFSALQARASRQSPPTPEGSAPPPASSPAEAAPTPAGNGQNTSLLDEADTQSDSAGRMPTRSRERRGPFGLQGRWTEGLPDGGPQEEGDPDQEGEAGQVLGGAGLRRSGRPGYPETHAPVIQATRSARGSGRSVASHQGSSCPGAQTPRSRTRTALSCRRSTACPGWKSRRPGERRLPLQQKLEPRDPMKAPVAQQDRRPADLPRGMDQ
jgi:hypothetical protein